MASLTNENTKKRKASPEELSRRQFQHLWEPARRRPTAKVVANSWIYGRLFTNSVELFVDEFPAIETCSICYDETKEKQACVLLRKTARGMEQCCSHKDYSICKSCMEQVVATAVNKGVHAKAFCPFCRAEFSSAAVCKKGTAEGMPPQISLEVHAYGKVDTVSQAINTAAAEVTFEVTPSVFNSMSKEQKAELHDSLLYVSMIAMEVDMSPFEEAKTQRISHPAITMEKCLLRDKIRRLEEFLAQNPSDVPKSIEKIALRIDRIIAVVRRNKRKWDEKHFVPFQALFPAVAKKLYDLRQKVDKVLGMPVRRPFIDLTLSSQ